MAGKIVQCALNLPGRILSILIYLAVIILNALLAVIFLPFYILTVVYQYAVLMVIYCSHSDVDKVSGGDKLWSSYAPGLNGVINCLLIHEGPFRPEVIENLFHDRLIVSTDEDGDHLFPKLHKYIVNILGQRIWIPEKSFDIKKHLYVYNPNNPAKDKAHLEAIVSEIANMEMEVNTSPWQYLLIALSEESFGKSWAACFRFHHSVGDGISLSRMLYQNLADEPVDLVIPKPYEHMNIIVYILTQIFQKLWIMLYGPCIFLKDNTRKIENNMMLSHEILGGKQELAFSDPIDLKVLKQIKKQAGITIGSILATGATGAIRDYMIEHKQHIPNELLISSMVFLKAPSGLAKLRNSVGGVFHALPLKIESDKKRLISTYANLKSLKPAPAAAYYRFLIQYYNNNLPKCMTEKASTLENKVSFHISNVPGPNKTMYLDGCPMTAITFWPLVTRMGMSLSFITYKGYGRISVVIDDNMFNSASWILKQMLHHIDNLSKAYDIKMGEGGSTHINMTQQENEDKLEEVRLLIPAPSYDSTAKPQ